ncbi:MAG: DUF4384 domain-containing protein, partial [Telluria sp.]
YSVEFLSAIDKALSVRPEDRPQSAAAMRVLLGLGNASATMYVPPSSVRPPPPNAPAPVPLAAPAPSGRKTMMIGGALAGALVVAGALYVMTGKHADAPPAQVTTPAAVVTAPAVAAPAVQAAPAPVAPSVAAAPAPFEPVAALKDVLAGASAERSVTVDSGAPRLRIKRDFLNFSVTAAQAGYVYVHMLGTAPNNFMMVFPNEIDKNNRIKAGETIRLPRKFKMKIEGPAGQDHVLVIVSDVPRDFRATGGHKGETFLEFSNARAAQAMARHTGPAPLFAGAPVCPDGSACSPLYAASMFSVEEVAQ